MMTLAFEAKFVSCSDAMDGEILQVCFDTVSKSQEEDERNTPCILISRNFEFPGPATIEWHDGCDYHGGAEIVSVTVRRDRISIKLDRELDINVDFRLADKKFVKLSSFLRRITDDRVCFAD